MINRGGKDVGNAVGYDTDVGVAEVTERACRLEARGMNSVCSAAEVVMLPRSNKECSGQVFFTVGTLTKRIV